MNCWGPMKSGGWPEMRAALRFSKLIFAMEYTILTATSATSSLTESQWLVGVPENLPVNLRRI